MALSSLFKILDDVDVGRFKMKSSTLDDISKMADDPAQDALTRLRKEFVATDLGDGNVLWERNIDDKLIEKIRTEADVAQQNQASFLDNEQLISNGEIPNATSPVARAFDLSSKVSGIHIPDQIKKNWRVANKLPGRLNTRLTPMHWDTLPTLSWKGKDTSNRLLHVISNPKQAFGELASDLVGRSTLNKQQEDVFGKYAKQSWEELTSPLSKAEETQFNEILREGNDMEETFIPVVNGLKASDGTVFEVSPKVQEAYYGTRMLMDHMYWVSNGAAVGQARGRGFKLLSAQGAEGEFRRLAQKVKPNLDEFVNTADGGNLRLTNKKLKEGWEVYEVKKSDGSLTRIAMNNDHRQKFLKEIPDDFSIVPYRQGYVPIIYKDQFQVHELRKLKDGSFDSRRVATADTRVKANQAIAKLEETKALPEDVSAVEYVWARKNDNSVDVDFGESMTSIIDSLSPAEIDSMKRALIKMGLSPEEASVFEKTGRFFSHRENTYMKRRGTNRLKSFDLNEDAPMLPADEAIYRYLQSTSSYQAHAEYSGKLETEFMNEFGELLENSNNFNSAVKRDHVGSNGRTAVEAELVRQQINRVNGMQSRMDAAMQRQIDNAVDSFYNTTVGKQFEKVVDTLADTWGLNKLLFSPDLSRVVARTKGFTAVAKLGLWNLSQAVVQGTAMLNVVGTHTPYVFGASRDMIQALAPSVLKIGRSKGGRELFEVIDRSGFIAGFDYVELQKFAAKGSDKLMGSRRMRKLIDTHLVPYHLGEGGVRALAWFAERRKLIDQINKGKSNFTKADIDSFSFLEEVSRGAMVPALNMSRMNQPLISRGLIGIPFQFKQFVIQQAEFMVLNKKNFDSSWQQARTIGVWGSVFGIQGIPFIFDILTGVESATEMGAEFLDETGIVKVNAPEFSGWLRRSGQELIDDLAKPVAKEAEKKYGWHYNEVRAFAQRWAQAGVGSALSKGEFDIASRASLAQVFTEYYGNTTLDDMILGPGYQTAVQLLTNNVGNANEMLSLWRNGEEFTGDKFLNMVIKGTQGLPGLQHPVQAAKAHESGEWRDAKGKLVLGEPNFAQEVLIGVGISPGKRGERFERLQFSQKYKQAVGRHIKRRVHKIAKLLADDNISTAKALLDSTIQDIAQTDPRQLRKFYPILNRALLARTLDEAQRELYYGISDALLLRSDADNLLMLGREYNDEPE